MAVALGGLIGPAVLLVVAVLVPALAAGVAGTLVRTTLLLSLPIAISAVLVNLFFYPGGQTVLLQIGPITATAEGLAFALEVLARILAISGA
ncbi:MAG TPA: energy-coupling factor transporter transmembrane protein EcfT, partial [Candidatus Limnocylindria bacterium]|nr:energy-coupling factor transporter transmembrane protein EcfT [Candidatus Limnocylindria bacterium]